MRFYPVFSVAAMILLAVGGCHARDRAVQVENAWVRLSAVPGHPAAAYFTISGGAAANRLVAIDSPAAGSSELHRSMTTGDMASMQRIDGVDVPAGATVVFAPSGYHVMLFGVGRQIKPGDAVTLIARFAKGAPVEVEAKVVGAGDPPAYGE